MPRPPDSNPSRRGRTAGGAKRTGKRPDTPSARQPQARGRRTEQPRTRKSTADTRANRTGAGKRSDASASASARSARQDLPVKKGWGSVARKGARVVREQGEDAARATKSASDAWREAMDRAREDESGDREHWAPDEWIEDEVEVELDDEPERQPVRQTTGRRTPATRRTNRVPLPVADELTKTVGAKRAGPVVDRLADASRAYERERYQDAHRILKSLAEEAPQVAAVRQLFGLTAYRMGRWKEAVRELEAYQTLSSSSDQHAVLADSYRALGRHQRVDELWEELRSASPSAEAVAEGRIVEAGSLADRGDLQGAIRVLEKATAPKRHPKEHHLRQWYALADLYERAGDIPRARDLFNRIAANNPESFDVDDRIRALR